MTPSRLSLPLGRRSEEAQESWNKGIRSYRTPQCRERIRLLHIAERLSYLMAMSDPKISSINLSAGCRRLADAMPSPSREALCLSCRRCIVMTDDSGISDSDKMHGSPQGSALEDKSTERKH